MIAGQGIALGKVSFVEKVLPVSYMAAPIKRPSVSSFVERSLRRIDLTKGLALDIPCGRGRHTAALGRMGIEVVAADLDFHTLHTSDVSVGAMLVQLDANRSLPFSPGTFDLAIVVHPQSLGLLATVPQILGTGGHLILETFAAHGGNRCALPRPREVSDRLSFDFEVIEYVERRVRGEPPAVTVKALLRKR